MNELEKFNKVWNGNFETTHWSGGIKGYTRRAYETKLKYERILFSIWRHHNDWDEVDGFQLKCFYRGCREYRTLYRVRKLAEEAGLLIKVGNYYVGDHTNYYQKNHRLFDMVFRGKDNQYGKWLEEAKKDISVDIIQVLMIEEFSKLSKENNYNLYENNSYVDTKPTGTTRKRKQKELNYDIGKLYLLSDTLFEHYYKLLIRLNNAVIHPELKFISFIHFNQKNMPTGRPYSAFCSTLNPKRNIKTHRESTGRNF
jgi:hypothetical protein